MVISGIIRPPPDIRAVADRTALFVSKNGRAFEVKILNSAKGKTPKFAFLQSGSPFHAYYEDRIRFYEEGGTDEEEKRKEEEEKKKREKEREEAEERKAREEAEAAAAAKKEAARKKASAVDPVARALLASRAKIEEAKRAAASKGDDGSDADGQGRGQGAEGTVHAPAAGGPAPPPPLRHVSLVAPANLSPLEVEVIKTTAQYAALSEPRKDGPASHRGDSFLSGLTMREWSNPDFAFLQPRHAHFAYFMALVDDYRTFLPGGEEYERAREAARVDARRERLASLIPDDDDDAKKGGRDAPPARKRRLMRECLEAAAYRAEYEREAAERRREAAEGTDGAFGGAGTVDWHDFVVVETIDFDADEVVEVLPPPSSLRLAALNKDLPAPEKAEQEEEVVEREEEMEESSSDDDVDMEEDDDDDDEGGGEKLKVVSNYQPKVVSTKEITGHSSRTHVVDPITGKSVAVADMPEHMRIQLLDPKWAEERRRFLEKQRETNFVAGEDIASNISRFAQARGDIFGASGAEIHDRKVDSERRLAEANRLIQEQAMQPQPMPPQMQPQVQPQMQPPPMQAPPGPPGVARPPPPPFAPPPPPGLPPPPRPMGPPGVPSEEPPAKRHKADAPLPAPLPGAMALPPPGLPPPPGAAPAAPPTQPAQNEPLSEADFVATLSNPDEVPICVRVPHDPSNAGWNFNGQIIDITVKATSKIKEVKGMLRDQLGGMPANKMQLKHPTSGFMNKDGLSLAHYNVAPMTTLDLVPKTRGGRKS